MLSASGIIPGHKLLRPCYKFSAKTVESQTLDIAQLLFGQALKDLVVSDFSGAAPFRPEPAGPASIPVPVGWKDHETAVSPVRRRRALCIGVDNYKYIGRLNGCINDAKLWASTLTDIGYQTQKLLDPDAATIRDHVRMFIESAEPGDSLVLQCSGHGTQFSDKSGDEAGGDTPSFDECFCALDCGGPDDDGLVIDDEFREMFGALPQGASLTSFFDCCHSGTMNRSFMRAETARTAAGRKARFVHPNAEMRRAYWARLNATKQGRSALPIRDRDVQYSACRSDQLAYEQNGQGDFTRHACGIIHGQDWRGISNSEFRDRVTVAFGSGTRQDPGLHCDSSKLGFRFLQFEG